jgi:hypothetical protein
LAFVRSISVTEPLGQNASVEVSRSGNSESKLVVRKFVLVVIQVLPPKKALPSRLTTAKAPMNHIQVGAPLDFLFGPCGRCSVMTNFSFSGLKFLVYKHSSRGAICRTPWPCCGIRSYGKPASMYRVEDAPSNRLLLPRVLD